jgi:hypothetical protein
MPAMRDHFMGAQFEILDGVVDGHCLLPRLTLRSRAPRICWSRPPSIVSLGLCSPGSLRSIIV